MTTISTLGVFQSKFLRYLKILLPNQKTIFIESFYKISLY